uniref:WASP family protein member n=1 Tax=Strongyloides papillosus TaxID=174720 RepID=A0A0N5CET4_STREA
MSITNRNSNTTSTTGLYRGKYNNNLSTGSELRSLSASLQPRSVGTRASSTNKIGTNNSTIFDSTKRNSSSLYSSPTKSYLGRSSIYKDGGNSMAITSAMSNLGSQHSISKSERPWRQRLADSARLRNLEGTGEIASKVSSKYMIQRAAKRDSLTSGDEMSICGRLYGSTFDKTSPSYLSSNTKVPSSYEKSTSGMSNNFQDDNDSGVMSKSVTSRSSWNNSIISNKSPTSQLDKSYSQLPNSTDNTINKTTDIKIDIRKIKHMDDIKESGIKTINNKKSIKERSKKKRKLRKKDSLSNIEIKKDYNYDNLVDSAFVDKPVIIKKIVKEPIITEFPLSTPTTIKPHSTALEITNEENKKITDITSINMKESKKVDGVKKELNQCTSNTEYIKRTPIKRFIQTTADKPKVINDNKIVIKINEKSEKKVEAKESSDESKYNDVVHFKLPSRLQSTTIKKSQLNDKEKKIPPIPGIFISDNNEVNISINKHFKAPSCNFSDCENISKIIYTKSIKNTHEKVVQTFKELKKKKKKILVIRGTFDLKNNVKEQCELLNYTFFDKKLRNKESFKKIVKIPKKPVESIFIERVIVKNIPQNNGEKTSIIRKEKSIECGNFYCKRSSLKQKLLNLDVIKKSEEKVANVTVMTSNIVDVNFNSISKEIQIYSPIHSIDSLTPKAMTEEPLSVDISLTLPVKYFENVKRSSAPPESSYRRRNKHIETRASIVLKRLRSEDPAIYDTQPTIIPEFSQKYIHLKADPNYIPGDPIILPDSSTLEEYVRRKRGNLEKYIHEPILEENSSLSSYSNNTLSHCDSPSIASTISEYHPPLPVKIIEPNFAHTSKIKPFKNISKPHITSSSENNHYYNMIDMVNINLNKPKFITNNIHKDDEKDNFLNLIRKPLRSREHVPSTTMNKIFDKPHSVFEERMQKQAKAVVLRRDNPSLMNSFSGSNQKTNESMNTSFDVSWSSPDTLNDKRRSSADTSNQNLSTHLNHNSPMTSNIVIPKQTLAQSFAQAAAAASQPRHERYAAHLPVSNNSQFNRESNGRHSTTSVDSNNSLVLEKASTQVEQMIDNAKFKHQQSRNKFKDAIEYLDQIFEDFKNDINSNENNRKNSTGKGTNLFPTTGYGGQNGHNDYNSLNNNSRRTVDPIKNVTLYNTSTGQIPSNNSSRKQSYSQNNSLIEDNVVEVSETIKLPPTNKKLSSDKLDFTQKWLVNDVKSWAHSQKSEPFMNNEPSNFDCEEGSVGSCSAEVAAINSKEKERKRISNVKNENANVKKQIPNNYLIKPHPYRPQPFPLEGGSLKKIPSIEQIQGNIYQPTGSQFFKPPSMVSLNELTVNRNSNRAQSQEYQGNNNEFNSGMYIKVNNTNDDKNKAFQNFGSVQSLPDAGMLRNHNGGSLKIVRKKDDAMKAIDALVAELEMNVNDENTKRKSFPLKGGNSNVSQYSQINKDYEKSINKGVQKPSSISNTLINKSHKINDSHQLDEMASLLTTVANDIGSSHPRRGTFNNSQLYESPNKNLHNPFEKINSERIGSSRVEAMHNIFENKGLQSDSHSNSGANNQFNQKPSNVLWNRKSITQKSSKPNCQNLTEEDNYYEVADFDINALKQKVPSKISLNSATYPDYIPSYPSSQPPSYPPPSSSINSLNHGFYSSTNSSSTTIPTQNTNSLHNKIKNQIPSAESTNQVLPSRQQSIVERHSLLSQNQNTMNNDEDDDGFYDNIPSNIDDERHYTRDNETLDNLSISSTKYSTTPRNNGNKLSNLLRKFSIGSNTNVKPSSTGSFISLNKMSLNEPINVNNKRNNLMKSNSLSMEPWEKQVIQGQSSGRRSPGNVSQISKKSSLGSRIKNSIFGSKKSLKNIY